MTTNYPGDPDNYPANVREPDDGDLSNAAALAAAVEDLADRTAHTHARVTTGEYRLVSTPYLVRGTAIADTISEDEDWTVIDYEDVTGLTDDRVEVSLGPVRAASAAGIGYLAIGFSNDAGVNIADATARCAVEGVASLPYGNVACYPITNEDGTIRICLLGMASATGDLTVQGWGTEGKHWGLLKLWRPIP